ARVVVLNSPNNPTGSALPEGAVERVLEETGALVVCDEAYQEFGGPTALPLLRESSRLVVLRTFSKALGLAGLRFGLALAHPAVAREIAKGKLPYNVNLITLAAARVALRHAPPLLARTHEGRGVAQSDSRGRQGDQVDVVRQLALGDLAGNGWMGQCQAKPETCQ